MLLRIVAAGRLKSGPERELVDRYADRIKGAGSPLGLGPLQESEVDNRALREKSAESAALATQIPAGAAVCLLDERGKALSSRDLARDLECWRDDGFREACFVIGGADGLDRQAFDAPNLILSFGKTVWPHMLVRAMLSEQLYRAVSILSGTPYHRD